MSVRISLGVRLVAFLSNRSIWLSLDDATCDPRNHLHHPHHRKDEEPDQRIDWVIDAQNVHDHVKDGPDQAD